MAGDGPDFEWLRTFVKKNRLDRQVRLLGALPNAEIRNLLAAADIFFLPSQWEGIALSVYEAMACGLPVVGADVGGQSELVTPECGVLIERGEEAEEARQYASALTQLLSDSERRTTMGQHARQRIQDRFRLEQMTDRFLAAYQTARREREASRPPGAEDWSWSGVCQSGGRIPAPVKPHRLAVAGARPGGVREPHSGPRPFVADGLVFLPSVACCCRPTPPCSRETRPGCCR